MSTYDLAPTIAIPGGPHDLCSGWPSIAARLQAAVSGAAHSRTTTMAIECYPGVFQEEIHIALRRAFDKAVFIDTREALLAAADVDSLVSPYLGGDDPVFGYMTRLALTDFFAADRVSLLRARMASAVGTVIVIGPGAAIVAPEPGIFVYATLARWEAQQRQRRHEIPNLGTDNHGLKASLQYKRSYFVDWRVCDRFKQQTMRQWDFLLDTNLPNDPKLVTGSAYRHALAHCATRPFRVVPFFDPGPWGGQWMKDVCGLDPQQTNFAWCFDCVPEENSLLLAFGDVRIEVPALDLVFARPEELLGEPIYGRFGPEFPIRFDFLDTMGGGNLSLQVHPRTEYIQQRFGMHYTQDESYYLLDARPDAQVFLGRKRGADMDAMFAALEAAQRGAGSFDDQRFVARFPARKHDHFLIPAGTLHCSGRNCMVLEISSTPYIFTFKLWDWNRPGLDGKPRPINIGHGKANIRWDRDEDYVARRLVNQVTEIARGTGWREERTGLHESEFIETRRHWFSGITPHQTGGQRSGSVNVLNLVEGREVVVESPDHAFEPLVIHYAETFIIPAAVGAYCIRPVCAAAGGECATIKAFVRCQA